MTRNGKIGRLPRHIRETLNTRLDDGEQAKPLAEWLNGLPAVQSILAEDFNSRPINAQNLSEWKTGGFIEWQRSQDSSHRVRTLLEAADSIDSAAGNEQLPDRLASILALELATETRQILDTTPDLRERWRYLCDALRHLNTLRQGDRFSARAALDRLRLEIETNRHDDDQERKENDLFAEKAKRPIFNALRRKTVLSVFGGGEKAEALADYLDLVDQLTHPPSSSPPEPASPSENPDAPIQPDQTQSS
jgi:hypothetical protein